MKNHEVQTFGMLVEQLRRSKRLTQEELAYRINTHPKTLSDIERDIYIPNIEILFRLAKKIDMKTSDIVKMIEERGICEELAKGTNDDHD